MSSSISSIIKDDDPNLDTIEKEVYDLPLDETAKIQVTLIRTIKKDKLNINPIKYLINLILDLQNTSDNIQLHWAVYKKNNASYDWFIYYDIDEFIYLKDFKSFKSFLNDKRFAKCNRVQFNWIFYTDNNLLYYEDKPVRERFTEKQASARGKKKGGAQGIKSVIRGNINNIEYIE